MLHYPVVILQGFGPTTLLVGCGCRLDSQFYMPRGLFQLGVKQVKICLSQYLSKNQGHSCLQTKKLRLITKLKPFFLIETAPWWWVDDDPHPPTGPK